MYCSIFACLAVETSKTFVKSDESSNITINFVAPTKIDNPL